MRYQEIGIVVAERLKRRHNRDIIHDDAQYKKFIQNHKKEKENAEKGLHEFINGNSHEFEITIEIKSKKHKIDLLQHEVEKMVKMMLGKSMKSTTMKTGLAELWTEQQRKK